MSRVNLSKKTKNQKNIFWKGGSTVGGGVDFALDQRNQDFDTQPYIFYLCLPNYPEKLPAPLTLTCWYETRWDKTIHTYCVHVLIFFLRDLLKNLQEFGRQLFISHDDFSLLRNEIECSRSRLCFWKNWIK